MLYIAIEPAFNISSWCRETVNGINSEICRRRISAIYLNDIGELPKSVTEGEFLVIVCSTPEWQKRAADIGNKRGYSVIVAGSGLLSTGNFSSVSRNIDACVSFAIKKLCDIGCKNIALYAVNPFSAHDVAVSEAYFGKVADVCRNSGQAFYNNGSLADCFETFENAEEKPDGVICLNDYAAVSFVKHLKSKGEELPKIISFATTRLISVFSPKISAIYCDYLGFGEAIFGIMTLLKKSSAASVVTVGIKSVFKEGETTDKFNGKDNENAANVKPRVSDKANNFKTENSKAAEKSDNFEFYGDIEIQQMTRIENLINRCDNTDLVIVDEMLKGLQPIDIAEKCFLSESGVKYRCKKMYDDCGCSGKKEFLRLVSEYISEGAVKELI